MSKNLADAPLIETLLESNVAFEGGFLKICSDRVTLPNGDTSVREYIHHPGAAMVIPITKEGELILVRQYRHPLRKIMIEFPAGKIDKGEEPIESALRELAEETGCLATFLEHITTIHNAAAYSNEAIYLYLARDFIQTNVQSLDENEFVQIIKLSVHELGEMIQMGLVSDVKTQLGFFWLKHLGY